jgi:hypothetical protein
MRYQRDDMGMSKKDYSRAKQNLKRRIDELEQKVRMDPLKRHPDIHTELAKLKKEFAENY